MFIALAQLSRIELRQERHVISLLTELVRCKKTTTAINMSSLRDSLNITPLRDSLSILSLQDSSNIQSLRDSADSFKSIGLSRSALTNCAYLYLPPRLFQSPMGIKLAQKKGWLHAVCGLTLRPAESLWRRSSLPGSRP